MVAKPRMTFSSALITVETWSIAVVCNGMGSRKWRTKNTLPNAVQPCEPCIIGMARLMPRKASEAPTGWLALSGFTASALLRFRISAMSCSQFDAGRRCLRPRCRLAHRRPHRTLYRQRQLAREFDHAAVTLVTEFAFLVDVE